LFEVKEVRGIKGVKDVCLLRQMLNRWSGESHHACMNGRVVTENDDVIDVPHGGIVFNFERSGHFRKLNHKKGNHGEKEVSFTFLGHRVGDALCCVF
jgi:hypothetical protein